MVVMSKSESFWVGTVMVELLAMKRMRSVHKQARFCALPCLLSHPGKPLRRHGVCSEITCEIPNFCSLSREGTFLFGHCILDLRATLCVQPMS